MLQNCKIIFFFFFITGSALAVEQKPILGNGEGCSLKVEEIKKVKITKLSCPGLKYESEQENLDNKFLRWGTLDGPSDTYILIFFTNGVHGERVLIFSRRTKKQVNDIKSSWPIEIKGSGKSQSLSYKIDSNSQGEYSPETYKFK